LQQSLGGLGIRADNALADSFNPPLKREVLKNAKVFPKLFECRRQIFAWCTRYNTKRIHTWCNYQAPDTFEKPASATLGLAA
ncbi:integrase core domain-containing protein, partial [Actinobaculum suis]|uniref:integrase core domain-containing protein n=1 Tax=Actinobaculum suis TaxID=1657 RepID=UPI000A5B0480